MIFNDYVSNAIEYLSLRLPNGKRRGIVKIITKEFEGNGIHTVLDIGCGVGKIALFKRYDSVGCDIFPDSVELARKNGNYKTVMLLDVTNLPFADKSFDAITCIDVAEHLKKEDSIKLVDNMERIARKVVFIQTSWGYDGVLRAAYLFGKNPYLKHLCGWMPEEFGDRGYKIYPTLNVKFKYGGLVLGTFINYLSAIILRPLIILYPGKFSRDFAAVKELCDG